MRWEKGLFYTVCLLCAKREFNPI